MSCSGLFQGDVGLLHKHREQDGGNAAYTGDERNIFPRGQIAEYKSQRKFTKGKKILNKMLGHYLVELTSEAVKRTISKILDASSRNY